MSAETGRGSTSHLSTDTLVRLTKHFASIGAANNAGNFLCIITCVLLCARRVNFRFTSSQAAIAPRELRMREGFRMTFPQSTIWHGIVHDACQGSRYDELLLLYPSTSFGFVAGPTCLQLGSLLLRDCCRRCPRQLVAPPTSGNALSQLHKHQVVPRSCRLHNPADGFLWWGATLKSWRGRCLAQSTSHPPASPRPGRCDPATRPNREPPT